MEPDLMVWDEADQTWQFLSELPPDDITQPIVHLPEGEPSACCMWCGHGEHHHPLVRTETTTYINTGEMPEKRVWECDRYVPEFRVARTPKQKKEDLAVTMAFWLAIVLRRNRR